MATDRSLRVTAAVVRSGGKILLARRSKGGHLAGLWEFPGGKIEEGETPEQCLARELQEEFAVQAEVGQFVGTSHFQYDSVKIELLAYEARFVSDSLTPRVHDEIAWVEPERLLDYELAPADIPIAERLVG